MARRPHPQLANDLLFEVPYNQLGLWLSEHDSNASGLHCNSSLKPLHPHPGIQLVRQRRQILKPLGAEDYQIFQPDRPAFIHLV